MIPSDYADLYQIWMYSNPGLYSITPELSPDLFETFFVGQLTGTVNPLASITNIRYRRSFNELQYHYHRLREGNPPAPLHACLKRCYMLYRQCLRYAFTPQQRLRCQTVFLKCRQLCLR